VCRHLENFNAFVAPNLDLSLLTIDKRMPQRVWRYKYEDIE
jgi:hypothetical protein